MNFLVYDVIYRFPCVMGANHDIFCRSSAINLLLLFLFILFYVTHLSFGFLALHFIWFCVI